MGTEDDELYEELKGVLFNDSAVAGEAAALAIGLVMLGSASPKALEEMLGQPGAGRDVCPLHCHPSRTLEMLG